ncbi:MAG: CRTAC1 family protein [Planctomycetaceae bacterium]
MIDRNLHRPAQRPDEPAEDDAIIGRMFRRSLVGLLAVALLAGATWWWLRPAPQKQVEKQSEVAPARRRQAEAVEPPAVPFSDQTAAAGITWVHENGARGDKLLPESMGGGCAILDYNNDGRPDILLVNSRPWSADPATPSRATTALYRNEGDWKFTDVSAEAGLDVELYGQGVAVGDFDNDGWCDVYLSAVGPNRLFRNQQGRFVDVTESAGVAGRAEDWSTSCGFLDYDRDGDLDLFVANYVRWTPEIDRAFRCTLDGSLRAYCRPKDFDGAFPYLFRNDGGGRFTDVSAESGVQVRNPDTNVPMAKSLGVVFVDADEDGWLDIVIANDTVQNFLFHNQRGERFAEVGLERGLGVDNNGQARGAMGCDVGWFRNDDTLAVVIGNFANEMTALYCSKGGRMLFTDDAIATGLGPPSRIWLKFGICFLDVDLDSRLDLLVANGHLENDIAKVQKSQQYQQPPQLYWNTGAPRGTELQKLDTTKTGPVFAQPLVGRGATYADFDGDGDLDCLLTTTGEAPRLLRNDQSLGHHWLRLRLRGNGTTVNRDAYGTLVTLVNSAGTQKRLVSTTRSYLSQSEAPVTFGLGKSPQVERLEIRWTDGQTQSLDVSQVDRELLVEQPAGPPTP